MRASTAVESKSCLLDLRDNWKTPVIINLDYPQANFPDAPVARVDFSQLGYALKLQLNLLVTKEMRGEEVQRQLLRLILLELMYRDRRNIAPGTPYLAPPDWLVDGLLSATRSRLDDVRNCSKRGGRTKNHVAE